MPTQTETETHKSESRRLQGFERWLQQSFGSRSIIMLANREPVRHELDSRGAVRAHRCSGGLVSGLEPVIEACRGVWVAHGSGTADRLTVDDHDSVALPVDRPRYRLRRVWLTPTEERRYYDGFANEGLWPLCHAVHVAPIFRPDDFAAYRAVNDRFARAVCDEAERDPGESLILVQDYHFALAPSQIRLRRPRATIVTFWHIPWPHAREYSICPWRHELVEGLLGSTSVGFQTSDDRDNFLAAAERFTSCHVDYRTGVVEHAGGQTRVGVYPISVEWPNRWLRGAPPVAICRDEVRAQLGVPPGTVLGVGVDRLDYTKGLEQKFAAIGRLLEKQPALRGRMVFLQIAEPSRERIDAYRELRQRVGDAVARINDRFGAAGYQPIILRQVRHEPDAICRLMRGSDFCFVASLHDGMNLVAKEFVSARDDENGVLILSEFAGAARELTSAVLVNPFSSDESADAIQQAIEMPKDEQARRMRVMRAVLASSDAVEWTKRMLTGACVSRRQSPAAALKRAS